MLRRTGYRRLAAATLSGLLASLGPAGAEAEETQVYRVEVLILRHLNNEARSFEAPTISPDPYFGDLAALPVEPERRYVRYRNVPRSDFQLASAYAQLRRSRDFRPLLHLGWTQDAFDSNGAGWVPVSGRAQDGTQVTGYARLTVSRYLHLRFELEADIPEKGRFRLEESRRMKSGDLHYFDHPEFGALVAIIPEPDEPSADE